MIDIGWNETLRYLSTYSAGLPADGLFKCRAKLVAATAGMLLLSLYGACHVSLEQPDMCSTDISLNPRDLEDAAQDCAQEEQGAPLPLCRNTPERAGVPPDRNDGSGVDTIANLTERSKDNEQYHDSSRKNTEAAKWPDYSGQVDDRPEKGRGYSGQVDDRPEKGQGYSGQVND